MATAPKPKFKPTLILHGGAGNIQRSTLPPSLYNQYHKSLLTYLRSTKHLLENGSTALDAAVHAVSLMEDDELFNCGRGSVFTSAGTIEMEASVMVTSLYPAPSPSILSGPGKQDKEEEGGLEKMGEMKRGAGVINIRNVRHPIQLAREVLLRTGQDIHGNPNLVRAADAGAGAGAGSGGGNMHSQLSGPYVEELAKENDWGLEFKPDEWFWTRRRWEEHKQGLLCVSGSPSPSLSASASKFSNVEAHDGTGRKVENRETTQVDQDMILPSQGTVGCVCLDQWGNLAVATSTGGLTNKLPGRVGDTPTLGAGFWAESWVVDCLAPPPPPPYSPPVSLEDSLRRRSSGHHYPRPNYDIDYYPGAKSLWDMTLSDCFSPAISLYPCLREKLLPGWLNQGARRSVTSYPYERLSGSSGLKHSSSIDTQPMPQGPPWYDYGLVPAAAAASDDGTRKDGTRKVRIAVAVSGTGNGDSFLRTAAARTACAMLRFSPQTQTLSEAVHAVAGVGGELQLSAGQRWGKTGEGTGGIIGIEARVDSDADDGGEFGDGSGIRQSRVVFDFNCGGMWRAWIEQGNDGVEEVEKVMVFKDEYE